MESPRSRRHAPMIRMKWHLLQLSAVAEKDRLRQMADGLSNGANSSAHARRKLKFDSRVFLFVESNDKQPMPDLRHSKIIGIKLTVKYPKTGCIKQLSKVSQFIGVHLVTKPQDV